MEEPLTEELLDELRCAPSPDSFLADHPATGRDLSSYLNELLEAHGISRIDAIHGAQINETYGYQLFKGSRSNPSRDHLLALALAMGLSFRETNRLLQAGGASELYCKDRRDAIIIFALDHGYPLQRTNEELYRFGETTVGTGS